MNREIKFRGKPCYKGVKTWSWIYGTFQYIAQRRVNPGGTDNGTLVPRVDKGRIVDLYGNKTEVICDTVGQFTGLYDKNGNEVYEGDILRIKEFDNLLMKEFSDDDSRFDLFTIEEVKGELRAEYISPVVYNEGCFDVSTNGAYFNMYISSIWGDMKRSSPLFEFEVIGNIYDNPGLIPNDLKSYMLNLTEKKGGSYAE